MLFQIGYITNFKSKNIILFFEVLNASISNNCLSGWCGMRLATKVTAQKSPVPPRFGVSRFEVKTYF